MVNSRIRVKDPIVFITDSRNEKRDLRLFAKSKDHYENTPIQIY